VQVTGAPGGGARFSLWVPGVESSAPSA
jgi:hypothetical protein